VKSSTHRVHFAPGLPVASAFGLGTISWGTKTRGDDLDRLYDTFRQAGGNVFDSAHVYAFWLPGGLGASERAMGEIVRRRGDRTNVILMTKGGHPHMDGGYPRGEHYLSPEQIASDVRESLDRIGESTIDLYFLHRDDPRVPVGEIIDLLDEHVRVGRLHSIGASNWTTARIAAANEYAAANRRTPFVASQPKFSLAVANPSNDQTVPSLVSADEAWYAASDLCVCAYSPTANGFFATGGAKGAREWTNPTTTARLKVAEQLASELGVTANQIALAWLLNRVFPVIPLLGTTNLEHLTDALGAAHVKLSEAQNEVLTRAGIPG
jgi:aryl-alcohol dehydrogenase-like predicted oxidoreductase